MLVEFSVSNFQSIGERVTFSAASSSSSSKRKDVSFETGNSLAPNVVKSAIFIGANASGKSSLIGAMQFFQSFVTSAHQRLSVGEKIKFESNRIVSSLHGEPSEFEIVFIQDDELFQYGFKVDNDRVHEEWLFARHSKHASRTRSLFYRSFVEGSEDEYEWEISETQVPGKKESWKEATLPNALFLSVAVQLKSKTLAKPLEWIRENVRVIPTNHRIDESYTASLLLEGGDAAAKVEGLMSSLDLKIDSFRVETKKRELPDDAHEFFSPKVIERFEEDMEGELDYSVFANHKNDAGELVEFSLKKESDGTQAIFGLAGPIFDVLENGYTLVVDELSNSLHPLALKALVNIFHDVSLNTKGAQLFFTSHEFSIMSNNLLHKDQIWFVERPDGMATTLTPLSDFDVREVLAFERAYLGGKFGALPNISKFAHQYVTSEDAGHGSKE